MACGDFFRFFPFSSIAGPPKIVHRPYPACQCLSCGQPQPNDFIVIFLIWLLVTRINYLERFKYEWDYTNVIPSKRKAKQCLWNDRVVFVHPCPEWGSEIMRCHSRLFCSFVWCNTNVSLVLSEFTCVFCSKRCFKKCNMLSKKRKTDSECMKYNETWLSNYFVKQHGNKVLCVICYDVITVTPYIREYSAPSNNPCTLILGEEILKNNKSGFN